MDEEKKRRETAKSSAKMDLKVTATEPDANGLVLISIQTGVDTSSLKINGEEQGGQEKGLYQIKRLPKVGQDTTYNIVAADGYVPCAHNDTDGSFFRAHNKNILLCKIY